MRKLNNKGFAVSTVLYGLLIMLTLIVILLMSHMSNNRKNTSTLVKKVEEELNRFSETTANFDQSNDGQEYIVPYGKAGWYKIELWGASGGGYDATTTNGRGAYTSGIIYLEENAHLYFYLGGQGETNRAGWNGGGASPKGGGGGATDVRLESGAWNGDASLKSRIMVAAGGGGSNGSKAGGAGGSLVGKKNDDSYGSATQNAGNAFGLGANATGSNGGGGGGYYGGRINEGGSSYISGYAGSISTSTNTTLHSSGKYFINAYMTPGVHTGKGKASIELVSQSDLNNPPTRKHNKLNNVTQIRDCINGSNINASNYWLEIQAISQGNNVAKGKSISASGVSNLGYITDGNVGNNLYASNASGSTCVTVNLGGSYNLDEVAVWHNFNLNNKKYNYKSHQVAVNSNGSWQVLKGNTSAGSDKGTESEQESSTGFHYSAWQPDTEDYLPNGNYYIFPAYTENASVTLAGNKNVELKWHVGAKTQKWYVERVTGNYYKVIESNTNMAMQNEEGSNDDEVEIIANTAFGNHYWELWEITPLHNGHYRMKSKCETADNCGTYATTSSNTFNSISNIYLRTPTTGTTYGQRFRFVNAEY